MPTGARSVETFWQVRSVAVLSFLSCHCVRACVRAYYATVVDEIRMSLPVGACTASLL